ncbi:hypothetical protein PFTANZ_04201 [Plasmodium falciparum Tanzania (2000708)]|uniref:Surface antigen n=1 Tax=Plasmodium falciparum Tanzania (2000708) TaxID=1036725 RepID=A0A024W3I9_PLAFA|nr:hypothetical protein PFTANZ_04201 [Plasmodium falciparum Tanzania (2000708)]
MASIKTPCISKNVDRVCNAILTDSNYWIGPVAKAGKQATALTTESVQKAQLGEVTATSTYSYMVIAYSVVAILIILLVMVIIYIVLRYLAVKELENAALLAAAQKGIATGIDKAIEGLKIKFDLEKLSGVSLNTILNAKNFKHPMILGQLVQGEYNAICESDPSNSVNALCIYRRSFNSETYKLIATDAQTVALDAGKAAAEAEEAEIILANAESSYLYGAIGYSVLVILIILLKKKNE